MCIKAKYSYLKKKGQQLKSSAYALSVCEKKSFLIYVKNIEKKKEEMDKHTRMVIFT